MLRHGFCTAAWVSTLGAAQICHIMTLLGHIPTTLTAFFALCIINCLKKQVSKTKSHQWQSVVLRTHLKSYQIFEILSCECRLLTDSFCCSTFLWSIFHGPFIRSRELGWFICCNILMRLNILVLLVTQVVLRCMNLKYKISTRTKLYTTLSVKSVKRFYMNFRKKHPWRTETLSIN